MSPSTIFLLPSLAHGGAQKVILDVATYLADSGKNVKLLVLDKEGELLDSIPSLLDVVFLDDSIVRLGLGKRVIQCFRLRKRIKEFNGSEIYSTITGMNIFVLLCFYFTRGVKITVREATSFENYSSIVKSILVRLLYPRANRIICTSEYIRTQLLTLNGLDPDKLIFLPNPIDIEKIRNLSSKECEHGWSDNGYRIISVGRLVTAKGFDVLIGAIALLRNRLDCQLVIVGEGPERESLHCQIKALQLDDKVRIIGYKKNPYPYMYASDLYVLSSRWEGYVNTLVEAMALGIDVVATDCKSGPGDLIRDELGYKLVPIDSEEALASAIQKALLNPRDTTIFEEILKRHSLQIAVGNYIGECT